jgi:hypothetical protein
MKEFCSDGSEETSDGIKFYPDNTMRGMQLHARAREMARADSNARMGGE